MSWTIFVLCFCVGTIYGLSDCDYGGVIHHSGDSFSSLDNCNKCFCTNGAVACTLKFCLPVSTKTCSYGSTVYQDGARFKALDGCNSCSCQNGMVSCTEMFCITGAPPP